MYKEVETIITIHAFDGKEFFDEEECLEYEKPFHLEDMAYLKVIDFDGFDVTDTPTEYGFCSKVVFFDQRGRDFFSRVSTNPYADNFEDLDKLLPEKPTLNMWYVFNEDGDGIERMVAYEEG